MRSIQSIVMATLVALPVLAAADFALAADAGAGRERFVSAGCYACHGYEAQGASTGPKLAPNPLPYEALSTFVRMTAGDMPPYTPAVLSEPDLQDIYAFLQSIPAGPDPDSIPLLRQ